MSFEGHGNAESGAEGRIVSAIQKAGSLEEVAAMLNAIALVMPELTDSETGNTFQTERVARAIFGDGFTRPDEMPVWLNQALVQAGLAK